MKRVVVDLTITKLNRKGKPIRVVERIQNSGPMKRRVVAEMLREIADELES